MPKSSTPCVCCGESRSKDAHALASHPCTGCLHLPRSTVFDKHSKAHLHHKNKDTKLIHSVHPTAIEPRGPKVGKIWPQAVEGPAGTSGAEWVSTQNAIIDEEQDKCKPETHEFSAQDSKTTEASLNVLQESLPTDNIKNVTSSPPPDHWEEELVANRGDLQLQTLQALQISSDIGAQDARDEVELDLLSSDSGEGMLEVDADDWSLVRNMLAGSLILQNKEKTKKAIFDVEEKEADNLYLTEAVV